MANNKTQIDRLHDELPRHLRTRQNPNWKALVEALGGSDQKLVELIEEVRRQFFVKTANRPYLDRLGSNFNVSRPRFIGMQDEDFRRYIPILAYQPKQVKLVMDLLLDIFFFKETTTAFNQTLESELFNLVDGWELEYKVDQIYDERVTFKATEFTNIAAATAEEIVSAINRQTKYSFAIVYDDRVQKKKFIRLFTKTIGAKGSVQVVGGRANIKLRFDGFNESAGSSIGTTWTITKIGGEDTIFTHTAGPTPNLNFVSVGDVALIDIPGYSGSFTIHEVDLTNASFTIKNLFSVPGVHVHTSSTFLNFMSPIKAVIYTKDSRAVVWEVSPGSVVIEMPATPPVVKRNLIGSAHINGISSEVVDIPSSSSLELSDASDWPMAGGKFILKEKNAITTHILTISENVTEEFDFNTRFDNKSIYSYTSKVGNIISGISPSLPDLTSLHEQPIVSAVRDTSNIVTVNTSAAHGFLVGENVGVQDAASAIPSIGIRVDVLLADSASMVATKTAVKINSYTGLSAFSLGNVVTVTNSANGITTDASDTSTGFGIAVTQQGTGILPEITDITTLVAAGLDVVGDGAYLSINTASDVIAYHVWYKVLDGVNTQVNPGLDEDINGCFPILSTPTPTSFTYISAGEAGNASGGFARVERIGIANSGSIVHLTSAQLDTGILGPHMWDEDAAFVLSSLTSIIQADIKAGSIVRTLLIDTPNNIENVAAYAIFDFGTEFQEGPVRILYKPTASTLQLDPAYVFKNDHDIGSSITVIRKRGGIVMSGLGSERAAYITDPGVALEVLQNLMLQAKSVGIFIEFLIRYPKHVYGILDVYRSGDVDLWPVRQQ